MQQNNPTKTKTMSGLDPALLEQLDEFISNLPEHDGILIEVLHHAQGLFGYLPHELQLHIAHKLNISGAKVFGVVSFYTFFTMDPPGEHTVSVCMGTACFVRGADKILARFQEKLGINPGDTTEDNLFTLKDVRCIGACGLAPVVMVGDKVYGRVTEADVDKILAEYAESKGDS